MKLSYVLVVAALLLSVGCDAGEGMYALQPETPSATLTPHWVAPEHGADIETRAAVGNAATLFYVDKRSEYADDWAGFSREVKAYLAGVSEEHRYMAEQYLGRKALEAMPGECREACVEDRRYYLGMLVESGYPDAAFMEEALAQAEDAWQGDELERFFDQAASNAERWLEADAERNRAQAKRGGCQEGEPCYEHADAMTQARYRIEAATERLREGS